LEVHEAAESQYRLSYDILVRAPDAVSEDEASNGAVRPNFLSNIYGGITLAEWELIADIPGVEVAAPISTLGIVSQLVEIPIDLTPWVASSGRQLLRVTTSAVSRGDFTVPSQAAYLYITDEPFIRGDDYHGNQQWYEEIDGVLAQPCLTIRDDTRETAGDYHDPSYRYSVFCVSRQDLDASFRVTIPLTLPMVVAAVDPGSEAALYGLDLAVVAGRYFNPDDTLTLIPAEEIHPYYAGRNPAPVAPALLANSAPDCNYLLNVTVDELPEDTALSMRNVKFRREQLAVVDASDVQGHLDDFTIELANLYGFAVDAFARGEELDFYTSAFFQPSDVTSADAVIVASEPNMSPYWINGYTTVLDPFPGSVWDSAYRDVARIHAEMRSRPGLWILSVVGVFDPEKTDSVASPALDAYRPSVVLAADSETEAWFGRSDMTNNLNPADYLQLQPTLLIPMSAVGIIDPQFSDDATDWATKEFAAAPISAIRVRVANVTGLDEVSQERIRLVAEMIQERTGLNVDIVTGSSLAQKQVTLTQTGGRPDLNVYEHWSVKGAILGIVDAVDTKSVAIAILVLLTCLINASVIASSSAQAQRFDLGVFRATGHRPAGIAGYLLLQQATLGLVSGTLGWVLAAVITRVWNIQLPLGLAALCIPAATLFMAIAGLGTARELAQASVTDLLQPKTQIWTYPSNMSNPAYLGARMLLARKWRIAKAIVIVATAIATCSFITSIAAVFRGAIVGTLFGDAIALQVRASDVAAAAALATTGVIAVALTLGYSVIEDQTHWATLRAVGWQQRQITTAIAAQGAIIGATGALLGVAVTQLAGSILGIATTATLTTNITIALAATTLTTAAATIIGTIAAHQNIHTALNTN
jgi:ABC-type lipoprotein release transport system permease subunit